VTLANALAGIAPHVAGEFCPVCDRNFGELDQGPLSAHIAAKIASLTTEAGRLQSLANERAEESSRLSTAQRNLLSATGGQLDVKDQADLTVRNAQMASAVQRLKRWRTMPRKARYLLRTRPLRRAPFQSRGGATNYQRRFFPRSMRW
jgi:DNA repair protein SbcC/Rad50